MLPTILELTDIEFKTFEERWPRGSHASIGGRAMEIACIYLRRQHPECVLEAPVAGADLNFRPTPESPSQAVEVKGTETDGLAWGQLKVSSVDSMKLLAEKGAPVYRVSNVFGRAPKIYILLHGKDFVLEAEPRWAFKSARRGPKVTADRAVSNGASKSVSRSKYDALFVWLQEQRGDTVTLRFSDAETVLGFGLPPSAYAYQAFWANQRDLSNRPWARAWTAAGFRVENYELSPDGWVRFRRVDKASTASPAAP